MGGSNRYALRERNISHQVSHTLCGVDDSCVCSIGCIGCIGGGIGCIGCIGGGIGSIGCIGGGIGSRGCIRCIGGIGFIGCIGGGIRCIGGIGGIRCIGRRPVTIALLTESFKLYTIFLPYSYATFCRFHTFSSSSL